MWLATRWCLNAVEGVEVATGCEMAADGEVDDVLMARATPGAVDYVVVVLLLPGACSGESGRMVVVVVVVVTTAEGTVQVAC